jgi:hypothetical protein
MQVVFPHYKITATNIIKGNVRYRIPEETNWYWFDDNPGLETLYIVASYTPLTRLETILATMRRQPNVKSDLANAFMNEVAGVINRGISGGSADDLRPKNFTIQAGDEAVGAVSGKTQTGELRVVGRATAVTKIMLNHKP